MTLVGDTVRLFSRLSFKIKVRNKEILVLSRKFYTVLFGLFTTYEIFFLFHYVRQIVCCGAAKTSNGFESMGEERRC
jgi:hypothetical protein